MPPTNAQRLADVLLDDQGGLEAFVRSRRSQGRSWRRVAQELYQLTEVDLASETLRLWYPDAQPETKAG